MKNEHILPNTEVPIELRKEVYKEALEFFQTKKLNFKFIVFEYHWLCWLLPSILYEYDCYGDIDNKCIITRHEKSVLMFPELKDFLDNENLKTTSKRIKFLKSVI